MDDLLEEEEEEEALEDTGIVLHLGLFFDGTGNNLANSAATEGCHALNQGMAPQVAEDVLRYCAAYGYDAHGNAPDNSYGNSASNVARLHDLYPDQSDKQLPHGADEAYLKVYLEGIGTRSGLSDSVYSQGTGMGSTGVATRVVGRRCQALVQASRSWVPTCLACSTFAGSPWSSRRLIRRIS